MSRPQRRNVRRTRRTRWSRSSWPYGHCGPRAAAGHIAVAATSRLHTVAEFDAGCRFRLYHEIARTAQRPSRTPAARPADRRAGGRIPRLHGVRTGRSEGFLVPARGYQGQQLGHRGDAVVACHLTWTAGIRDDSTKRGSCRRPVGCTLRFPGRCRRPGSVHVGSGRRPISPRRRTARSHTSPPGTARGGYLPTPTLAATRGVAARTIGSQPEPNYVIITIADTDGQRFVTCRQFGG